MESYKQVRRKLEAFIRKFYLNKLLKGLILFFAIGLLYFLVVLAIEHFLWLEPASRTFLFWIFVGVEVILLGYFILIPLTKLFKFSNGINDEEASKIIGAHFPEVDDKLLNVLQLKKDAHQSELLLAGIEQKSAELNKVPFTRAVDYKENSKYLKYALFPLILILGLLVTGNINLVAAPLGRLAKHNTAFEAPAPFRFLILNDSLMARENTEYKILVKTEGNITPEKPEISYNGQTYFLKQIAPGSFEYTFKRLQNDVDFRLSANGISSEEYNLETLKVPKLLDFNMKFDYPDYIGKVDDSLSGTGNVNVPEGTKITWDFNTRNTDILNFSTKDSLVKISAENTDFQYSQAVYSRLDYRVSTSNNAIKNFEALDYSVRVIKDEYPEMEIQQKLDSIDKSTQYFYGKLSDDYGLNRLNLVYYIENKEDSLKKQEITISKTAFDEFHYTFPGDLDLEPGETYNFYFQLWDNDGVNGSKSTKSSTFSFRRKTADEIEAEKLKQQRESIDNLGESLRDIKSSEEELNELNRLQKENENLDYNQRKKFENFIQRQKQQSEMMRNYSEKFKKSFEEEQDELNSDSAEKEELKKRLDRNEERLKENEALLKELQEIADKINREELGEKLEELSKRNQSEERNLEQLLELTKRYYVEEKLQKLARDLDKLSEKQEGLAENSDDNSLDEQEEISEKFEEFQEEMNQLEKDNNELRKPTGLPRDEVDEESIKNELNEAKENLENKEEEKAKEKQKNAAQQMKKMSQRMQQISMQQSGEELKADIKTLRQILDNLIAFSFQQEDLLDDFNSIEINNPGYAAKLRRQSDLRENFRHIDDSLYSLALSNPMITEEITKGLTDIEFDINKSLERLAENELPQGTASQQYVVTGANDLAYMLSEILSMMQQQANPQMGKGDGKDSEFQLRDIIKKQQGINKEFQEKGEQQKQQQKGKKPGEGMGEGEMEELFEIYKDQQELRQRLQELNKKEGSQQGKQIEEQMKEAEEQLLDKGFDPQNLRQLQQLEHELMELEDAKLQQGENNKRESKTNLREFDNTTKDQSIKAKEYFNSIEILNRQTLPLREIYKQKVKTYFERTNN
ncbi:hypothetical protein APR41_01015 [Salegentibacter salinarum]|uniref:Glutamyl-tRNA synthetase n=1 Tax=Salegentibacter salinarum TaxID=447422 RepID=A0A2N0U3L4_9FLAO|nr:hypothetical protein [Salegentibacter salinarum]PKD21600.1 hypothetical protein APR41_01015 [Salegentibacter salinarum]SKB36163.1 hypothetical protein SAMN05660903_00364 [Salegentibacter salinarum]